MINVLTIDVEEYFHAHALESNFDRQTWPGIISRIERSTHTILDLLDVHGVSATFFVLGWVAERNPQLVRDIADRGHEIASHGYWHKLVYRQTPKEFERDVQQSLAAIGQALNSYGCRIDSDIKGYRAPSFSINQDSLWALDILKRNGIIYDSSIFPLAVHDRYGIYNADRFPSVVSSNLWEFPVSTVRVLGFNWPVAGGGYFRLCPLWITRLAIQHINNEGYPAVVYLHPWEFDPEQPRAKNISLTSRMRHYVNIQKTEARLDALLSEFSFSSIRTVYSHNLNQ